MKKEYIKIDGKMFEMLTGLPYTYDNAINGTEILDQLFAERMVKDGLILTSEEGGIKE